MKTYQVPQIEEMMVEKLMQETPGGHSGGPTPGSGAPQRLDKYYFHK